MLWGLIVGILTVLVGLAANPANAPLVAAATATVAGLMAAARAMRTVAWNNHTPIDHISVFPPSVSLIFSLSHRLFTLEDERQP